MVHRFPNSARRKGELSGKTDSAAGASLNRIGSSSLLRQRIPGASVESWRSVQCSEA